ncbi:MIT C-terminal domain-containing protein [Vibrio harveyi]
MITTFFFDHEIFLDDVFDKYPDTYQNLLNIWEKYGCFAYSIDSKASIYDAVKSDDFPAKYQQKYTMALGNFKTIEIAFENETLSQIACFQRAKALLLPSGVLTGIVPRDYLEDFKPKNDSELFEIIQPANVQLSKNFSNSELNSSQDLDENDKIEDVWKRSIHGLSIHCKKITIIDRYLVKNILEDRSDGKITSLEVFTKLLAKNKKNYYIEIFSACDIGNEVCNFSEIKEYFVELRNKDYTKSKSISFKVNMCKNKFFSEPAHDRMIVMDTHAIQTGKGLDIFRKGGMSYCQLNIKHINKTHFRKIHARLNVNTEKMSSNI